MTKSFTNRLFRAFTLMAMIMATSLVGNAAVYLLGDYDGSAAGWAVAADREMTLDNGVYSIELNATDGFYFKIYDSEENKWYGAEADGTAYWINGETATVTLKSGDAYKNLLIKSDGKFRFEFNAGSKTLVVTRGETAREIVVTNAGGVSVNPTHATAGETVTITVNPDQGYYAEVDNVTVEVTVNPGSGQAPRHAPAVGIGEYLTVSGTALAAYGAPATYTFTMPDAPKSARVTVDFKECTLITDDMFEDIADQVWTGNAIEPVVTTTQAGSELTTDDYTVTYATNTDPGTATVTITGTGKYTGTVTKEFTIAKEKKLYLTGGFNNWGDTANPEFTYNEEGDYWQITVTMQEGCQFKLRDQDEKWYGTSDSEVFTFTEERLGVATENISDSSSAPNFAIFRDGEWTITVSGDLSQITVTGKYAHEVTVAEAVKQYIDVDTDDDPILVAEGETVTFTVNAPTAVQLTDITVSGNEGSVEVTTVDAEAGKYSFVMPDYNVTISANVNEIKNAITLVTDNAVFTINNEDLDITAVPLGTEVNLSVAANNADDFVVAGITVTDEEEATVEVAKNEDGTYTFVMPNSNVTVDANLLAILHGVTFTTDRKWATYFGNYDLTAPDGVEVYAAKSVAGDNLEVEQISYIPATVGVLLYSETPMADITTTLYEDATAESASILVGAVTEQEITAGYVLYNNTFIRSEEGTLAAHRCYLPEQNAQGGNGAPRLMIRTIADNNIVTAIADVDAAHIADVKYVNMQGMTSDTPFPGVNIKVITRTDGSSTAVKIVK